MLVNAAVQYVLPAAAIAASPRPASDAIALVLGHAWGWHCFRRHGAFHAGRDEWNHHERRARALRGGTRRIFLFSAGRCSSRAFTRRRSQLLCRLFWRSHCFSGRKLPAVFFTGHFFGMAVLHDRRQHDFCFRKRDPKRRRPYRVWGYPVVPTLFVAGFCRAALLHLSTICGIRPGMLVILAGIPVFYVFARKRRT